jgi:hypothetical protein
MIRTRDHYNETFVFHKNCTFLDILSYYQLLKIVIEHGRLVVAL